jgi:hypothetical protein
MLHGGGGTGYEWEYDYQKGHFGDINRMKFVFPTSPMTMEPREHHMIDSVKHFFSGLNPFKPKKAGGQWYLSYKNGCGLDDDCAYDIDSIHKSADRVSALIQHEME